jgi:hypothetical protein
VERISLNNQLRSEVTNLLAYKLAKRLNNSITNFPWAKMTVEDIINWPSDVKFMPLYKMNVNQLRRLYKLAKQDRLDFSPEFIRFKERQLARSRFLKREAQDLIRDIETSLFNKLNSGTNKTFKRVPWSLLKKNDIINWPDGIPFVRLSLHSNTRLKLLHKLRVVISFSEDFLKRLSDPSFDKTNSARQILQLEWKDHKSRINLG